MEKVKGSSTEAVSLHRKEEVLTQAVLKSSDLLGISRKELSEIIGISEATISRMHQGNSHISLNSKEAEAATQLVRIYRSLDSLFGGKPELCSRWLKANNFHLGGVPLLLAKKFQGLIHVAGYLDAMRARV